MQSKLLSFFRLLFTGLILGTTGFVSCLTAMRLAIRGNEVSVPNVVGHTVQEATRQLSISQLGLKIDGRRFDDRIGNDRVISQEPSPNSSLKKNRNVRVVVSLGVKKVQVPDLRGESLRVGQIALLKRGLSLGMIAAVYSETAEKDRVISQDPLPEVSEAQSSSVNMLVSSGRRYEEYLMPELMGGSLDDLQKECDRLGFRIRKVIFQPATGLARGTILKQLPSAGQKLIAGDSIDIEVSR